MKKLLLSAFLCLSIVGFGQTTSGLILEEHAAKAELAEGNPYLFEEFNSGSLKITTGSQENLMIRYNLAENNLLASLNGKEYTLKKDMIEAFTLMKADGKSYNFIPLRIGTKQYFVEQLYDHDNVKFVKWHRKQFKKGQPQPGFAAYENSPDRFEESIMYLFVIDGTATEYTQKKDDLLQLLASNDESLKAYLTDVMKKQKLKAKDESDVVELLQSRQEHLGN